MDVEDLFSWVMYLRHNLRYCCYYRFSDSSDSCLPDGFVFMGDVLNEDIIAGTVVTTDILHLYDLKLTGS